MPGKDLCFASAATLGRMMARKEISAVEVARLFLGRLERYGPLYNALARSLRPEAEAAAKRVDRLRRSGTASLSPLAGVPYGVKDIIDVRGRPTELCTKALGRRPKAEENAAVVDRLADAGMVIAAKLALIEFTAYGGYKVPWASALGPCLNPWDTKRWAGGSSSGSGAAVAAGLLPVAIAAETWGSILTPAGFCGVTGLRPTWGRTSRYGSVTVCWSMDKLGPLARTAEDCGLVLAAWAGEDRRDVATHGAPPFRFTRRILPRRWRVGVLPGVSKYETYVQRPFREALKALSGAGVRLVPATLPPAKYGAIGIPILYAEEMASVERFREKLNIKLIRDPRQRKSLRKLFRGGQTNAAAVSRSWEQRAFAIRDVREALQQYDAVVAPSLSRTAIPLTLPFGEAWRKGRGSYCDMGAVCGVPELTLPMGFGEGGCPVNISFIGDLYSEDTLLQLGMLFQRETDWHLRHPPVPPQGKGGR
jgi:aspartyl-tRNA(Asn)/glutamyl-tRNA(Gln) amidotransferase subunit A